MHTHTWWMKGAVGGYLARLMKMLRMKLMICRLGTERLAEHMSLIRMRGAASVTRLSQHWGDHRVLVSGWASEEEERAVRVVVCVGWRAMVKEEW